MDPTELLLLQDLILKPHAVRALRIEMRLAPHIPEREGCLALKGHLNLGPVAVAQVRNDIGAAGNLGRGQIPDLGRELLLRTALFVPDRLAHFENREIARLGGQVRELVRVAVEGGLVLAFVQFVVHLESVVVYSRMIKARLLAPIHIQKQNRKSSGRIENLRS